VEGSPVGIILRKGLVHPDSNVEANSEVERKYTARPKAKGPRVGDESKAL